MIGVLIAAHGEMAVGIVNAVDMICGGQEKLDYISLQNGQDVEEFRSILSDKVMELDDGDGVIIMTDILGATPMNQSAILLYENENIHVVTGVNLPMVAAAVIERNIIENCSDLTEKIISDASESILNVRTLLEI